MQKTHSDNGLLFKIYTELLKFNNRKQTTQFKKWAKDLNIYLTKEGLQMANKYMRRCSTSYRETRIRTMRYPTYLLEWPKFRTPALNAGEDVEQ